MRPWLLASAFLGFHLEHAVLVVGRAGRVIL